eukprot:sb/3477335/
MLSRLFGETWLCDCLQSQMSGPNQTKPNTTPTGPCSPPGGILWLQHYHPGLGKAAELRVGNSRAPLKFSAVIALYGGAIPQLTYLVPPTPTERTVNLRIKWGMAPPYSI